MTEKHLEQIKGKIIGQIERTEEAAAGKASQLAFSLREYGKEISLEEQRKLMDSITLDELRTHASKVFSGPPTIAAYGKDATKLPYYSQLTQALGHPRTVGEDSLVVPEKTNDKWAEKTDKAPDKSFRGRAEKTRGGSGASLP